MHYISVYLRFLLSLLNKRLKNLFIISILLSFATSLFEVITIGSLIPIAYLLLRKNEFDNSYINEAINSLLDLLNFNQEDGFLLILIISTTCMIFSMVFKLLHIYFSAKFSTDVCTRLSYIILKNWLNISISKLKQKNSSELVSSVTQKSISVGGLANQILIIINSLASLGLIGLFLFILNPIVTISLIIFSIFIFYIVQYFTGKLLLENSLKISKNQSKFVQMTIEIINSIKQIVLDNKFNFFLEFYKNIAQKIYRKKSIQQFYTLSPKVILEGLIFFLLIFIIFLLSDLEREDLISRIPILVAFIYSLQRILPLVNQLIQCNSALVGNYGNLKDIKKIIKGNLTKKKKYNKNKKTLLFKKNLLFKNVSFRYDKNEKNFIIDKLSIDLKKSKCLGIIGPSGSGKSTLIELIIGFLEPDKGNIYIDNHILSKKNRDQWHKKISYVPQKTFILDDSIDMNIAFGENNYNLDCLNIAKKSVDISNKVFDRDLKKLKNVGENGSMLSGGQLQRISIARALYKKPELLILDEATNQLDIDSELQIIKNIKRNYKELTIIIISHRKNIFKYTDKIINLKKISEK